MTVYNRRNLRNEFPQSVVIFSAIAFCGLILPLAADTGNLLQFKKAAQKSQVKHVPTKILPQNKKIATPLIKKKASQPRRKLIKKTKALQKPQPFPKRGILPKEEIGALRLLEKHPEYDGRGTVVAIFDTGVDPAAAGLQKTSDGRPKVIDMVDGTGSGDVDTSIVRKAEGDSVEGLSGRKLKINSEWLSEEGEIHLGIKRVYELYPSELLPRLKEKRREKFDLAQRQAETALRREIIAWDAEHSSPTPDEQKVRDDLETRLAQLQAAYKKYDDPGPIVDCVVFQDGDTWRAVVDTDADGDLAEEKAMTNFRVEREFNTFQDGSQVNFAVNIYDSGRRLSIVNDGGAHGTHVAGIVAANFPQQPELNGIAPGAQIVSVKIGDNRILGMETAGGMVRGLKAVIENKCDLINMSFGEPTSTPGSSRLSDLFTQVVEKYGVIFVSSAGNAGPALSTVGAPGGTNSAILGVGAYVSPAMMTAEYALREKIPETSYTWTSRGPTFDGDPGVNIFAPGGAIAPVPQWTLNRNVRMNGTSMASPNACGGIALLLSAMKATSSPYSPNSVRRSLENTARLVQTTDRFAQGTGLIQVDRALEHLQRNVKKTGELQEFSVRILSQGGTRGIYLREPHEVSEPKNMMVIVRPVFHEDAENLEKSDFEMRFSLQATQPWVTCGQNVMLNHSGSLLEVRVDPTQLKPGVHFAEVLGLDSENMNRGPMFRVPVTVIVPQEVKGSQVGESLKFTSGHLERRFFVVPEGATWADLTLRLDSDGSRRFFVHKLQRRLDLSYEDSETQFFLSLQPGQTRVESFSVTAGMTMELCLAQYWSSLGSGRLEYELNFHGIVPSSRQVALTPDAASTRVEISAPIQNEVITPQASLRMVRSSVAPSEATIKPLSAERDLLADGRQIYRLLLTYKFDQPKSGRVTPRFPRFDTLLYDSPLGGHLWMLYDSNKRRIAVHDVWPLPVHLEKGEHVLRLQLRHTDVDILEKAKGTLLFLERPLEGPISLGIYASKAAAVAETTKISTSDLQPGERLALHITAPEVPASLQPGDVLLGAITYGKNEENLPGGGKKPDGYPLSYVVPEKSQEAKPKKSSSSKTDEDEESVSEKLKKEIFDFKVSKLKQLATTGDEEMFNHLAEEILDEKNDHLQTLVAMLHFLDREDTRKDKLSEIVAAADRVLGLIDQEKLVGFFGVNVDLSDEEIKKQHEEMNEQREILIDTLYRKGRALGYMELPEVIAKHPIEDVEEHDKAFKKNFAELKKWVDTTEEKYFLLHVRHQRREGRYGLALELLNKHLPNTAPDYWHYKKQKDIYESLGWKHWHEYAKSWLLIRFPKNYQPL